MDALIVAFAANVVFWSSAKSMYLSNFLFIVGEKKRMCIQIIDKFNDPGTNDQVALALLIFPFFF